MCKLFGVNGMQEMTLAIANAIRNPLPPVVIDSKDAPSHEEVILNPERFNSQMCYENLRSTLVKEIVLYGCINNIPIVKSGTYARGYNYDQIGGVFTDISQRHQGYATAVMTKLLKKIFSQDKSASLFVKPDNINAIKLYKTLGFVKKANFRIAYSYN